MKWFCGMVFLLLSGLPVSRAADAPTSGAAKINLRILYAGHPASAREQDFVKFLKQYFLDVKTGDLETFEPIQAKDADVVIFDYDGDGFKAPQPKIRLEDYHRATMTVGIAGGAFCNMMRLKTGYL